MGTKKKILIISGVLLAIGLVFVPNLAGYYKAKIEAEAAGGYPVQVGLTNIIMLKCFTTGVPPICNGGTYCYTKDAATCTNYYDVTGAMSGGTANEILVNMMQVSQAGLAPGGQLIAGMMSPMLPDSNAVVAGPMGCAGCTAKMEKKDRLVYNILDKLDNFIIAGK